MKSEAYCRGEREYSFYGLRHDTNPFPRGSQDYEDYNTGMNQASRRNPALGARIKQDDDDERLALFKENQKKQADEKVAAEKLLKKKISNFKKMKDGY